MTTALPADDALSAPATTFRYRSFIKWSFVLLTGWAVLLLSGCVSELTAGAHLSLARYMYLVGVMLGAVSTGLTARRASRGLTLDAEGVTLHTVPIHLPWSNVSGARVLIADDGRSKRGVLFTATDPQRAIDGSSGLARRTMRRNLKRSGGPLVLAGPRLNVPAEDIVAVAEQFMAAPAVPERPANSRNRYLFLTGVASTLLVISSFVLQFANPNRFTAPPNSPTRLAMRDCFDIQRMGAVTKAPVLSCATSHDAQVYAVIHLSGGIESLWGGTPSAATIRDDATSPCTLDLFAALDPDMLGRQDLKGHVFYPSRRNWSAGDRTAICFITSTQGKITGSLVAAPPP